MLLGTIFSPKDTLTGEPLYDATSAYIKLVTSFGYAAHTGKTQIKDVVDLISKALERVLTFLLKAERCYILV